MIDGQVDMTIVGLAANADEALETIGKALPDVAVIDISLPGVNGVMLIERLLERYPSLKCIALTAHEDPGCLRQVLAAGGRGFVVKRSTTTDLLQAIRCVLAGDNYVDPALAARILSPRSSVQGDAGNLSERERSVIQLVAFGYSNKEISSRLNLSIKTIETYRTRATDKLELHSRAAIVRFAQSVGWLAELQ
ncbi:response regulator transcription factor [Mesorhizobium sp. M4B.F.Ca.ET.215.01.1.1]|nr:response regulator transcription factor [Mesorhizobium sp. M4B.F.Ca.ET.013.02.1.1]RUW68633.1 response regulator transcription factor [Mesorhizobium sp. M4B.F.Ca.ET.049.02.1.2]RVD43419.1 response regulator transcription factor [Mesorhizobium sp. M4B.F.Ca.ET.019.03.1.1]RWA61503.1 MAG: response regulator transcription factor [Mesorhizobium sp.]RWX70638.1 response regulator [Mesorhizobium sp. M4B.F.Ca.ET.089.01.1.1]TGQ06317.1 response regulator transcription factor [Mesorhizobium sp. M4B.F.Ca.E